jgi:NhaP-type Na+/H+ or K+/H+ antiporter
MIRLCGAALGFFAFAITVFLGLAAGNPAEVTILRAVWAMVVFCTIGLGVGWVANRVLDEHTMTRHREMFAEDKAHAEEAAAEAASGERGTDAAVPAGR